MRFLFRYFGWLIAILLILLWQFAPWLLVAFLDANLNFLTLCADVLNLICPPIAQLLYGVLALVTAMSSSVKFMTHLLPEVLALRMEATVRIIAEAMLILIEVKVLKLVLFIPMLFFRMLPVRPRRVRQNKAKTSHSIEQEFEF